MDKIKLYEGQKNTLYELQNKIGLSRTWLYEYAKGKYNIEKMPVGVFMKISEIEKIEPVKLFKAMIKYKESKR